RVLVAWGRAGARVILIFLPWVLHALRNDDVHSHAFIHRRDIVVAGPIMKNSDDSFLFAVSNPQNAAFSLAVLTDCPQLHQHAVAMHGIANIWGWDEDVTQQLASCPGRQRILLRGDKTVAIAMHLQASGDQILARGGGRQAPAVLANRYQLALPRKVLYPVVQVGPLPSLDRQIMDNLLESGGMFGLSADKTKDFLLS